MNLIEASPRTKFILFHGGYPWVGETGAIMQRNDARLMGLPGAMLQES